MSIQKSDYPQDQQDEIQRWVDATIPERITSLTAALASENDREAQVQFSEDIFEATYTNFATIMRDGFLLEVAGLNGRSFSGPTLDEARVQLAGVSPTSTPELFPFASLDIDPVQTPELTADTGSFNVTLPAITGSPPTSTPTGANENAGLILEAAELSGGPSVANLDDLWKAQEAALLNQITALGVLVANILPGQPGETEAAAALVDANAALVTVQALIAAAALPPGTRLGIDIPARQSQISSRVTEITDVAIGDKNFYRDERYFWLRRRINLRNGSLGILANVARSIADLTAEIADLTTELDFYLSIGFTATP